MEHSLATEQGWKDYGKQLPPTANVAEAFTFGWANLVNHQPGFDHRDRARLLRVFMEEIGKRS